MKPGEFRFADTPIEINKGRKTSKIRVSNLGDRPVQVGSHFHFAEINREISFDRTEAIGMRLNIPAGTAVRFEPGEEKEVELVEFGGNKKVHGLNDLTNGPISDKEAVVEQMKLKGFIGKE